MIIKYKDYEKHEISQELAISDNWYFKDYYQTHELYRREEVLDGIVENIEFYNVAPELEKKILLEFTQSSSTKTIIFIDTTTIGDMIVKVEREFVDGVYIAKAKCLYDFLENPLAEMYYNSDFLPDLGSVQKYFYFYDSEIHRHEPEFIVSYNDDGTISKVEFHDIQTHDFDHKSRTYYNLEDMIRQHYGPSLDLSYYQHANIVPVLENGKKKKIYNFNKVKLAKQQPKRWWEIWKE